MALASMTPRSFCASFLVICRMSGWPLRGGAQEGPHGSAKTQLRISGDLLHTIIVNWCHLRIGVVRVEQTLHINIGPHLWYTCVCLESFRQKMQSCSSCSVREMGKLLWNNTMYMEDTPLAHLFMGQLLSSLKCTSCGYTSTTFDPIWDLALPFPEVSAARS